MKLITACIFILCLTSCMRTDITNEEVNSIVTIEYLEFFTKHKITELKGINVEGDIVGDLRFISVTKDGENEYVVPASIINKGLIPFRIDVTKLSIMVTFTLSDDERSLSGQQLLEKSNLLIYLHEASTAINNYSLNISVQ